ncbi:hypothetical protein GKQ38_00840 [Candidatus Nanohaloarchaea archaeon]|nr:hypothetical protein GKQ38_00840 [Candidatus Nanohaloarchaea archaeon]
MYQLRDPKKGFTLQNKESEKVKVGFYIDNYQDEIIRDLAETSEDKSRNQVVRDLLDMAFRQLMNSKPGEQTAPEMER